MRYKIILSYDGSAFCGWQIQKSEPSVQAAVECALKTLVGSDISVTGAGRTDTGVNARGYAAHFDCNENLDCDRIRYKLNAILPREIAIHSVEPTSDDFHARFSAVSREYRYFIHFDKDPFSAAYSWLCHYPLDMERMNRACQYLLGVHDCSCFEKTGSSNKTSVCEIFQAQWTVSTEYGHSGLVFRIRANRFLRNMVRAIVGTMVDIGRGVREPEYILDILDGKGSRGDAGQSVPGHALFLTGIEY